MNERPPRGRQRPKQAFAALRERIQEHVGGRIREHAARDRATRDRLLEAAMRLFASDGFRHVTVRDIAREAHANVAAVNYHFGDKMQLYMSVVQSAVDSVREVIEATMQTAEQLRPEDKLRHYLRSSLLRMTVPEDRRAQIQKFFSHEMMDPTPATPFIVEQIVRPRLRWLGQVVAEIMAVEPSDARVQRCVSSIQAQFLYAASPVRHLWFPEQARSRDEIEAEVEHIYEFSLAGIRAAAARDERRRARRS
jgi:AcrR family transcriptional regulator